MDRIDELRELYAFNRWANRRILGVAGALSAEDLGRDTGSSFPSVRRTLAHILESETAWVSRWRGLRHPGLPEDWDLSTVEGLRSAWAETEARQEEFLAATSEEDLDRPVGYRDRHGREFSPTLWQMLRHVVNHSSYHRGQVVTMVRQVGGEAVSTDLIHFYRERASGG